MTIARFDKRERETGPRTNEDIRADKVRVIDADGEMLGVLSTKDALQTARDNSLDLIEISPGAEPPVCRIGDYGKFRYEQQKKAQAAKKKQKTVETKELKFRPNIDEHDVQVKLNRARRFFQDGNKVKFSMFFRGRQNEHKNLGRAIFERIREDLSDEAKIEQDITMQGSAMMMVMGPATAK